MLDENKIIDFHDNYSQECNSTCGWPSVYFEQQVHKVVSSCQKQDWTQIKTVLDIGSGEGGFVEYLRNNELYHGEYLGLDVNSKSLEVAQEKYADESTKFVLKEFTAFNCNIQYDWVFCIGAMTIKQEYDYERDFIKKMINLSKYGLTIYLNDIKTLPLERREKFPDLAAYNIEEFTELVSSHGLDFEVRCFHQEGMPEYSKFIHAWKCS